MKEQKFEAYFGRKIAIDASMSIYQFLVCTTFSIFFPFFFFIRLKSSSGYLIFLHELMQIVVGRSGTEMLTNEAGEVTRYPSPHLYFYFLFEFDFLN